MAYITTLHTRKEKPSYRVEVGENGQKNTITLDGNAYTIDWQQIAQLANIAQGAAHAEGHFSLLIGNLSYDIFARRITRPGQKGSETYELFIGGQRFEVTVEDERTRLLSGLIKGAAGTGTAEVTAPMPGLVVGLPVAVGDHIEEGQTVAVLEAMKMENDLTAPLTGKVTEIRVQKGQTVDQGDILVVIAGEDA
ncbi:biotin-dependent enzyme [Thermosporothrix hazakensis]|jgi:acetyl/propionyl-CoA carboxylase alpha subunit|uniref:Biotin-dependent enzyme n=1 Tax=Thermosporothrix hazakensis TaxID=644383 RepID=A0A326UWR0_THEHA|nr:acetyl-CoA carboxylase biotin carboxyl carrier protein subunit [Thermosporothrix hazakensis]PZW36773.1 biotin-dependent enzyme [Thermosporothrix hazakensis]GCE47423.1 hypothetical protein KTH_22920 [Thermosporothrix hazakensis]